VRETLTFDPMSIRAPERRNETLTRLPKGIVPDAKWIGMYRLRLPGGGLSDMVNVTRAKDAVLAGRSAPEREYSRRAE
jgi:hypothetical protein